MEDDDDDYLTSPRAISLAIFATVVAVLVSIASIYQHLVNYTCPDQQRYIIRLLFTCPLYAVTSLLSLIDFPNAIYYETVRDCYESLVIYSFMVLILEYAGGEANCVTKMQGRPPLPYPFPGCWLAPRPRTVDLLRECKRGTLQFVVLKPLLGLLSMIMVGAGAYDSAAYQTFLLTVYNVAYTVALYYLLLFYLATKEACAKHQPVTKFVAVKSVVFFTYYQSIGIRLLPNMTFEEAQSWGDFILCVEMIMFSLMLGGAFGAAPYDQSSGKSSGRSSSSSSRGNGGSSGSGGSVGMTVMGSGSDSGGGLGAHRTGAVEGGGLRGVLTNDGRQQLLSNARNALTVRDIVADTYHNFASKYQDYALQTEERDDGLFVGSQRSTLSRHSHPYYDRSSSSSSGKHLSSSSGSFLGIFDTQRSFKAALDARRRRQRSRLPVDMTGDGIGSGGAEDGGVRELYFIGTCWGVETSLYLCVEPNVGASTTEAVPGAGVGIMTSVSSSSDSALMKEEPASASAAAAATISDACVCHGEGLNCNGYFEVKGIYRKVYGDFVDPSSYVPHLSPQAALSAGDPVAWRAAVACGGAPPPEPAAPPRRVLEGERFELSCVNNHGTVQLVLSRRLGRDDDDDDDVVELEMVDDGSANTPTASKSSSSDTSGSDGAPTNRELPNHQQHPRKRERAKFGGALWAQHAAPLVQFHKLAVDLKANLHQAGTTMLRRSRSSRNNNAASGAATSPSSSPTSMSTPATTPEGVEAVAGTANGVATSETDGACSDAGVMEAGVAKATSAAAAAAAATVAEDEDSSNGVAEDVKAEEASSGLVWLNLRGLPSADAGAEDTLELHDLQALGGLGLRRLNETSAARAAVLARRLKWRNDTAPVAGTSAAGVRAADTSGSAGGTAVAAGSAAVTDAVSDATAPPAAAEASALTAMNLAAPLAGSLEDFPPMVVPRGIDCSGEGADFEPMTQPEIEAFVQRMARLDARDNALVFEDDDDDVIINGASPSARAANLQSSTFTRTSTSPPPAATTATPAVSSSTSASRAPVVLPILRPPPQPLLRRPHTTAPPLPPAAAPSVSAAAGGGGAMSTPAEAVDEDDTFSPFHSSEVVHDGQSGSPHAPTLATTVEHAESSALSPQSKSVDEEVWDEVPFESS